MQRPGHPPDDDIADPVLIEDAKRSEGIEAGHSADPASTSSDPGDLLSGKSEVFEAFPRAPSETLLDERYVHSLPQLRPGVQLVPARTKEASQSADARIDGPVLDPAHGGLWYAGQRSQTTLGQTSSSPGPSQDASPFHAGMIA